MTNEINITEEVSLRVLKFKVTPVSKSLVCLDLPSEAGPMVDAKEFARLRRLAERRDRLGKKFWQVEGEIDGDLKELRWHLNRRTLTNAVEARINRKIAKRRLAQREIGEKVDAVRDAMKAVIEASRTLRPLARPAASDPAFA